MVELKRHDAKRNQGMVDQLLGYMKLLRLEVGVLICDKIYVYTYVSTKADSEQDYFEVDFERDSYMGMELIGLISPNSDPVYHVKLFLQQMKKFQEDVEIAKEKLTPELICELAGKCLKNEYSEDVVDVVLSEEILP